MTQKPLWAVMVITHHYAFGKTQFLDIICKLLPHAYRKPCVYLI